MTSQVFPDGGGVKGQHEAGVCAGRAGADGAKECDGIDHVVVVRGELVPVLQHHVLHHLLDSVAVGEAGRVDLQTCFTLEGLRAVVLLDVPDSLRLEDVLPAVSAPLAWPALRPREEAVAVVPLDVLLPLQSPRVTESDVTSSAGQLQLAHQLAPVLDTVNTVEVSLYVLHDLAEVPANPEPTSAQYVWGEAEFAVDPVEVVWHDDIVTEGLGYGDI